MVLGVDREAVLVRVLRECPAAAPTRRARRRAPGAGPSGGVSHRAPGPRTGFPPRPPRPRRWARGCGRTPACDGMRQACGRPRADRHQGYPRGSASTNGRTDPAVAGPFEPRECRLLAFLVGRTADDVEATVELHVDLAAVVARHLDLVVALLVADLGLRDLAAARALERRCACLVERGAAADRLIRFLGPALVLCRLRGLRRRGGAVASSGGARNRGASDPEGGDRRERAASTPFVLSLMSLLLSFTVPTSRSKLRGGGEMAVRPLERSTKDPRR